MFDTAFADEERHINKVHLDALAHFLGRHDVETGQMALGFWAYDFCFIPVEIISAIYEGFMKDADLKKKQYRERRKVVLRSNRKLVPGL